MSPSKKIPIILSVVSNEYGIDVCKLTFGGLKRRRNYLTEPKYVVMHILKTHTSYSMRFIGSIMGYSKTVSALEIGGWVNQRIEQDEVFKRRLDKILAILPQLYKIHK